ncbi:MAG: right-handed parallel beta-helix repeat-containing protein [Caldilineaceae bacterium]
MHPLFRYLLAVPLLLVGWLLGGISPATTLYAQSGQTHVVTSAADSGPGTLRTILLVAQAGDTIRFDPLLFPITAPTSIYLQTSLPAITTDRLTIDASNAAVILDGGRIAQDGLVIAGTQGVVIQGLELRNFLNSGITLSANTRDTLIGGQPSAGAKPQGQGNVISGNEGNGIWLEGATSSGNRIIGNYIGVKADGLAPLRNTGSGIILSKGVRQTVIEQNVISSNTGDGIRLNSRANTDEPRIEDVKIRSNRIGLTRTGDAPRGNGGNGIFVGEAVNVEIGGSEPTQGNLIADNGGNGILLNGATQVRILFNSIGVQGNGTQAAGNKNGGLFIAFGTQDVVVEQNVISGNAQDGIYLLENNTQRVQLYNNWIGVDRTGKIALPNQRHGVTISGAQDVWVGGSTGQGNLISGNRGNGLTIQGSATQVRVGDNLIGTDSDGKQAIGNRGWGIYVDNSSEQQIGVDPTSPATLHGNVISGNGLGGVALAGASQTNVAGNLIGANISATGELGNQGPGVALILATDNQIGATGSCQQLRTDSCNVISGNSSAGIRIESYGTQGNNRIIGNAVGAGVGGRIALGNQGDGIVIENSRGNLLQGNRVYNNSGFALRLSLGNQLVDNEFVLNRYNYARVAGGAMPISETWSRQGDLDTYFVIDKLIVSPTVALTLQEVNILFDFGKALEVQGQLTANGTLTTPIRLSVASQLASPLPGDWPGITFQPGSIGQLTQTSIEFAKTGMTLNGGEVSLNNSSVVASQQDGILVKNGALHLVGSNELAANGRMAICNLSSTQIMAEQLWWGQAEPPRVSNGCDTGGKGITPNVQVTQIRLDPRPRNGWQLAPVLTAGLHQFLLTTPRDVQWFRILAGTRNQSLQVLLQTPPKDYDLFLFSDLAGDALLPKDAARVQNIDPENADWLEVIARVQNIPGNIANVEGCSPDYLGQLNDVGGSENSARLLRASCQVAGQSEAVTNGVNDQSGWYYVLVAGHNGAAVPTQPYSLTVNLPPGAVSQPNIAPFTFALTTTVNTKVRTLILTHQARLEKRYGGQVQPLMRQLTQLSNLPEVNGVIVDLAANELTFRAELAKLYEQWDASNANPSEDAVTQANLITGQIKAYLVALQTIYPNIENILIVGGDEVIPFRRIPDEVVIANERDYSAVAKPGTALSAALTHGYFFTDNYYAAFHPIPWRGRELYLPELALGRLVETPTEIMSALAPYLTAGYPVAIEAPYKGLCVGTDFMLDTAQACQTELNKRLPANLLNSNTWTAHDLRTQWFSGQYNLIGLNAHFTHDYIQPAAFPTTDSNNTLTVADVANANTAALERTLIFSIGCHSGLSIADGSADKPLDFAQLLVGKRATYIANTGYGYGDANALGYSERLIQLFIEALPHSRTIGQALLNARLTYYNELGSHTLTPYDEKVLSVATLYGLPMVAVALPSPTVAADANTDAMWQLESPAACLGSLTCRQVTFRPEYERKRDVNGVQDVVRDEKERLLPGQPLLPSASIAITLPQTIARGVLFTGGRYTTESGFDPVIAQAVTATVHSITADPPYTVTTWQPADWQTINSIRTPEGRAQRLVVTPSQYRAVTASIGEVRRFTEMHYTLYYTTTRDTLPPAIWQVMDSITSDGSKRTVIVEASDFSEVMAVVVAYTLGDGEWKSLALTQTGTDQWSGSLDNLQTLEYFVQAVDRGGNVAVHDNKGSYFPNRATSSVKLFLPMIVRSQ